MASLPISQLPELTELTSNSELPVSQDGVTYKIKRGNMATGKFYGSFYHSTTQSGFLENTTYILSASTISESNGITVINGTNFTVSSGATYNLQFSAQVQKTQGGSPQDMYIWLKKNGTNVKFSNTKITLANNNDLLVASWNFVITLSAGEYLQLAFQVTDPHIIVFAAPESDIPEIPSVIVTVVQI
jgi:hypothetical protein